MITEGFELARNKALEVLEDVKIKREVDRDTLIQVARTSLRTKVHQELADLLTEVSRIKIDMGPDRERNDSVVVCLTRPGG